MIHHEISILIITAISLGFIHTLVGPDHYLPFIMLSRAQKWSYQKTLFITVLCGIGHVLSSVVIGLIGVSAGVAISKIQGLESLRGNIASYLLLGFGLAYTIWGIRKLIRSRSHDHDHIHCDGENHSHHHSHQQEHSHFHQKAQTSVWWLFIIFVLGPCEPLIPLLMYPAAQHSPLGVFWVSLTFGTATVLTMTVLVSLAYFGLKQVRFQFFEKYIHVLGGSLITLSAVAIIFLGL